jgi:hypothetical protein
MKTITFVALAACIIFMLAVPGWAQFGTLGRVAPAQAFDQAEKRAVVEKAGELLVINYIFPDRAAAAKAKIDAGWRLESMTPSPRQILLRTSSPAICNRLPTISIYGSFHRHEPPDLPTCSAQ